MTTDLSVRVVGVGDAFTARYYNACLLFEAGSTRLLIDAPPALARALRDLSVSDGEPRKGVPQTPPEVLSRETASLSALPAIGLDDIDHVLITHLHGDHVGGLEQLLFWRLFVTKKKVSLYAVPEVLHGLWDTRLRGGMETLLTKPEGPSRTLALGDYADVIPLTAGDNAIGDLTLQHRPTIHHIPTSAVRVRVRGQKTSIGYSADTAFDPTLIAWLAETDLFFHETNLGVHTPLASLVTTAPETQARMRLIHYPDFLDPETAPILCAREGERYVLG